MKSIRGVLLALALLIFGVLAVTACGGDDDDTSRDDATSQPTEAATDDSGDGEDATATEAAVDEPTDTPDAGGNNGGGGDASDVCNILSKEDVEGAFGVTMGEPEYVPLPDVGGATVGSCSYAGTDTSDSFSLTLYAGDSAAQGMIGGACAGKESAGVGDESCWYSEAHTEIQMLSGSNFVDIFVTTVDGDAEAIASTLADRIHGQIGG